LFAANEKSPNFCLHGRGPGFQAQILSLLAELKREFGMALVLITHDLGAVAGVADRVAVMQSGRIIELGTVKAILKAPRHPYTRMLLDAIPDISMSGRARTPVQGEVPNPLSPPSGCSFHPRCPHANARCKAERPALLTIQGVKVACHAIEEGRLQPEPRSATGQQMLAAEQL